MSPLDCESLVHRSRATLVAACLVALALTVGTRAASAQESPWRECSEGEEVVKLLMKITTTMVPQPDGTVRPRPIWYDFKQFVVSPEMAPLAIELRVLALPKPEEAVVYGHEAQLVEMAEGQDSLGEFHASVDASGKLVADDESAAGHGAEEAHGAGDEHGDSHNPDKFRADSSWRKPRKGVVWAGRFGVDGPVGTPLPGRHRTIELRLGPIPVEKKAPLTLVVHPDVLGGLDARHAYATVCKNVPVE